VQATASNLGPVIAGMELAKLTGNSSLTDFALKAYAYWWANMVDVETGQIADHVTTAGDIVWWSFTYNQVPVLTSWLGVVCLAFPHPTLDFRRVFRTTCW
jgi:hypothetical protein